MTVTNRIDALWRLSLGLLFALLLLGPPEISTADEHAGAPILSRIVSNGTLRVGMTGDQAPLNVKDRNGNFIGMEVDLAQVLASSMGVKLEIVEKPFPDLLPALKGSEVDLIMSGMTVTPERNMQAAFVGPYFLSGKSILTKSSSLSKVTRAEELNSDRVRISALEGSTSQKFVEAVLPNAKLKKTQNYDEAVQLVLDDKVDAMVADLPICLISVLRHPDANLATLTQPLSLEPIAIAAPPGDPLLVNLLENYLRALEASGGIEALRIKWVEDPSWLLQLEN